MNTCIDSMVKEHELIVQVLASLQTMAQKLASGESIARQDLADFGRFFRDFADQAHHGKEEDRLFVKMIEVGFPRESGPLAVMLAEHDAGREEVRALLRIGAGSGPLSTPERSSVLLHVNEFVPLLYGHIQKENNILYPMAQNSIPAEDFERLDEACEAFDRELRSRLDVGALQKLAADLARRFPADPETLAVYGGCGACHSVA